MSKQKLNKWEVAALSSQPNFLERHLVEGGFILTLTVSIFVFLSLATFERTDPGWFNANNHNNGILNAGGKIGAYVADLFYWLFGYSSYMVPIIITYGMFVFLIEQRVLNKIDKAAVTLRGLGLFMLLLSSCGLLTLHISANTLLGIYLSGGVLGKLIAIGLNNYFNLYGALLILFSTFLVGFTWLTGLSWLRVIELIGYLSCVFANFALKITIKFMRKSIDCYLKAKDFIQNHRQLRKVQDSKIQFNTIDVVKDSLKKAKKIKLAPKLITDDLLADEIKPRVSKDKPTKLAVSRENFDTLPELSLLDKGLPGKPSGGYSNQELEGLSRDVEQNLLDFGVNATVVAVHPGPVITRFELQLAAGIKVSRLTALAKDLARSLSVTSVRVVEIIPGKTVVGIELPNPNRVMVRLSEVLSSSVYQEANSSIALALGVDIAGHPMVVDLAKMPHLLVAGTTGSGKSVGINAMILSILFQATPKQVRLILVDPKMLELSVYDGIPHLLTPVVTDMREAASALRWCVGEMERRYRLMSAFGVRNLASFNTLILDSVAKGAPISDPLFKKNNPENNDGEILEELPYVVVVIDELADMMMVVGKKVEQLIARIAQKARAAGIHLILATQRPSVDVLTGLIKSNIPTRISFQVSSKIDSRTILDQQGAEQLLGHGDMLFLAPGTGAPLRVHGAFVDDKEVHRIADDWRARGEPNYIAEITQQHGDNLDSDVEESNKSAEDSDPLYDQVVEFVVQTRKASISSVQRRFKIGYNRAARLVEDMEQSGLVGPLEGGFRDVLVPVSGD